VRGQGLFHLARGAILFCAGVFLLYRPAAGTSVRAPRFETLVDRAELIFTGRALGQRSEWRTIDGSRSIVTVVSFHVETVHKGKADSKVALQFLGGTIGNVTMDVAEMPRFTPGERAVLFVEGNGVTASPIIGFYHGRFPIRKSPEEAEEILRHDGAPLTEVAEIGHPKRAASGRARRAMSHGQFSEKIRDRLARSQPVP
jgi:hypothetical protein